ncbi:MAG: hypothetical protein ABR915_20730 [Thermoguttaceae bacterium]|jgi:predicted GH43/DUF377 family glycosyl hydrolase
MEIKKPTKRVLTRYEGNPVLTGRDFPWMMRSVYNSSAVRTRHKNARSKYVMLTRCNQLNHETLMWAADSADGLHWKLRPAPYEMPDTPEWKFHTKEVYYDPRIQWLDGEYKVLVATEGNGYCRVACFTSPDLETVAFSHWLNHMDARNMVLFPEKSRDGRYMRLDRPNMVGKGGKGDIWLDFSPDLVHWGDAKLCLQISDMKLFALHGLGPSTNPVRIDDGWLIIFHTVVNNASTREYAAAAAILDYHEPWRVKHVTEHPILWPEADYELKGHVDHVCFTCSMIVEDDGTVKVYYGGADFVQCVALGKLEDIIFACKHW